MTPLKLQQRIAQEARRAASWEVPLAEAQRLLSLGAQLALEEAMDACKRPDPQTPAIITEERLRTVWRGLMK